MNCLLNRFRLILSYRIYEMHSEYELPRVGTSPSNLSLTSITGTRVDLSSFPKPLAISFMRHLA